MPRRRLRAKSDAAAGNMYRGTTMAGIIMDEAGHDPKRGFSGGYEMETLSLGLPFMATFLNPGAWGRSFTTAIDGYSNMAGMWLVGEDLPQETNRVTLDPVVVEDDYAAFVRYCFEDPLDAEIFRARFEPKISLRGSRASSVSWF